MTERKSDVAVAPAELSLSLNRIFDAPRGLVFEAFTKKEHIDRWMCPHGFNISSSGGDLREGGEWHCVMISPQGERCAVSGVYQEIVPDDRLVFSHGWEGESGRTEHWTRVTIRFEDAGPGRTKLTVEQSIFRSVASRDAHIGGWSESLEKLSGLLAEML